jgi:hypothetical protein
VRPVDVLDAELEFVERVAFAGSQLVHVSRYAVHAVIRVGYWHTRTGPGRLF